MHAYLASHQVLQTREDGNEITCAQSSLSMALFLHSPHNIPYMPSFIQMVFCLFSILHLSYSYK